MPTTSITAREFSADYYDQTDHWSASPSEFDFEAAKSHYHGQIETIFDALSGATLSLSTGEVIVDVDSPEMDYHAVVANAARQALSGTEEMDFPTLQSKFTKNPHCQEVINEILDNVDYVQLLRESLSTAHYEYIEVWISGNEILMIERPANERAMDEEGLIGTIRPDRGDHTWFYDPWAWTEDGETYISEDGMRWDSESDLIDWNFEHGCMEEFMQSLRRELRNNAMSRSLAAT